MRGEDRVVARLRPDAASRSRDAVVAIEDQRFYEHHGVDFRALIRAAYIDCDAGRIVKGGSTITQQLVKNLYVGDARHARRKIDEAALAWQLEDQLTKEQILAQYLNTVYFGEGAYGVQAAARQFFNEDAKDLTLAQSATLAGSIAAPNDFDPAQHHARCRHAAERGARRHALAGHDRPGGARQGPGAADPPAPAEGRREVPRPVLRRLLQGLVPVATRSSAPPAQDRYNLLFNGGLRITTTLDPQLQGYADHAVNSILTYNSDPYGAMTVIDPRTGCVRAMVGGRNYWDEHSDFAQVNLATGGSGGRQARIVVQAVRAGGGPRERHLAADRVRRAQLDRDPAGQRAGVARRRTPRAAATGASRSSTPRSTRSTPSTRR